MAANVPIAQVEETMERNKNIDFIKGLLIILVVLGHGLQFGFGSGYKNAELFFDDYLFRAIYTFHMPLFMFISGYLFYYSNQKSYTIVVTSKIRSIGIPWATYSFIIYALTFWFSRMDTFYFSHFIIMMRNTMWFLSSLLLNCFVVASVTRLYRDKCKSQWVLTTLIILTFFIPGNIIPNTHIFMFSFFLFGYWCCQKKLDLNLYLANRYVMLILTCVFVTSLFYYNKGLTIYRGGDICILTDNGINLAILTKDVLMYLIGIMNGLWFLGISQLLTTYIKHDKAITLLGRKTLSIYGFQCIAYVIISACLDRYRIDIPHNYVTPTIITLLILLLCEFGNKICRLNKYSSLLFLGIYNKQANQK